MTKENWVVMIEQNVWIATWGGDPGRTLKLESAKRYKNISSATFALAIARRFHEYPSAKIYKI